MARAVLIEGAVLLIVGFVGLIEGLRMYLGRDPHVIIDMVGPDGFLVVVSVALIITGLLHLLVNSRKKLVANWITADREMTMKAVGLAIILGFYILSISIVGFLISSIVFFLLAFRVAGVKSWPVNIFVTLALTGGFYIIFVRYCGMIFPRGIFSQWGF